MAGTSTNNGNQQVSIYPYQQLSSIYGNEISYGILNPGVYSSDVTITDNGSSVNFNILAGTTLVFQRTAADPLQSTITDTILGKIVLGSTATVTQAKATLWTLSNVSTLYLVADWTYSLSSSTLQYANFSISTDANLASSVRNADGTSSHVLIIAAILNNNYYVTNNPAGSPNTSDMTKYHISKESQSNRDVLKREYIRNNQYRIDFDPNGLGVYVNAGHSLVGNNVVFTNSSFGGSGGAYSQPETTLPFNLQGSFSGANGEGHWYPAKLNYPTGLISPAAGLIYYYPLISQISAFNTYTNGYYTNYGMNNNPINITGSETNYYQIDFLRIRMDEVTHTQVIGWDSFLQPVGSFNFTTFGGTSSYTYASSSELNIPNKMAYLNQYIFPMSGDGEILLIAIRPRGATYGTQPVGVPTGIPGSSNTLWPESCIIPRDASIAQMGGAAVHKRLKLPVWNASDLGVN
jgi:hypothetical protein